MKKFCLFLFAALICCPAWAQAPKELGRVTLDMFLKNGAINAVKKGVSANVARKMVAVTPEILSPEVTKAATAAALTPTVPLATKGITPALSQPMNTSLLAASTDLAQQIVRCGQSYVGFPQYDYLRSFYDKMSDALPEDLTPTLSSYGELMLERKYPGIIDAEGIAENALEEVSEYIPSYNALKDALEEAGQVSPVFASLEHQIELSYPSFQFEGAYVRTFRDLEKMYADGQINGLGGHTVRQALKLADEQGLAKDTGFFVVKVGKLGQKLHDLLVLDFSKLQWSSYKKTLENLPEMLEE